ncbi:hypothetical protein ACFZAD_24680 [Streptomyces iakyrus]|uniref:hypothetical protein n=1 Tax=Streptomyces iakyrus TaxID=68219 RepID=UPI0036ECE956
MMKKAWEAIALLVAIVILASLISAAIEPFLPILGIVVIGIATAWVVRFFYQRRRI